MEYKEFIFEGVRVRTALFPEKRREMHAYLTPTMRSDAGTQIAALSEAASRLMRETGLCPVFKRWLLSDPANQRQLVSVW